MAIDVSFIIPHKGRTQLLVQTIKSITQQKFDLSRVEIIVVTQNSDLDSASLQLGDVSQLQFINRPESDTISRLRNIGTEHSSGHYLAFLDADIQLFPDWVSEMINLFERSNYILIGGSQENSFNAPAIEMIRTALSNAGLDSQVDFLPGCNLFMKKSEFIKSDGFPEELATCEDYYFSSKLQSYGEIFHTSKAKFIHLGEDKNYIAMFKKEIWRGLSNLKSLKGRKIPIREVPSILVPIITVLLFLSGVTLLASNQLILAAISVLLLVVLILIYVLRLMRLVRGKVKLPDLIRFYLFYFPARAIGTLKGFFQMALN